MTSEQLPFYIGRYKVTGRLGSGGMGVVYVATDERLHRRVAIKRLLKNPSSSSAHLRIRKEALLLAQLNHSNIVQIYDVVEERNDVALVMEYVDGCSLDYWQREHRASLHQKIQLLKQICNGLARAHSVGIIHRDLKADNILIDENNTAKITDFGIAKNWREESELTLEQHVAGSWGVMSPEQALGKPLDNRCDLFSFGVLAYQLLCGQKPFGAHESPFVIVDRIVNNQHPPASKLNPELPQSLCLLLDKLLAKNPDKRPLNATAVAAELEAVEQELETSSSNNASRTVTVTAESFYQRRSYRGVVRKALFGMAATAVATLLVGVGSALWPAAEAEATGQYIAVVAPDESAFNSREEQLLANNVLGAIKQGLSNLEGLFMIPYSESEEVREMPLQDQAQALNAQLLLHPQLSCSGHRCEASLEVIDTGNFSVTASRSAMLELDQGLESRSRILQQLAYLFPENSPRDRDARFTISPEDYERYLELFSLRILEAKTGYILDGLEELQRNNAAFPPYYELFANIVVDHKFNTRSSRALGRLEAFLRRAPGKIVGEPEVISAQLRLALSTGKWQRSRTLLDKLKLALPDQGFYYFQKSVYHIQRGEYELANEAIDHAIEHRASTSYLVQKAVILSESGDMESGNAYAKRALELTPNRIDAISLLAGNMIDSGRADEGIRLLTEVGQDRLPPMDIYNLCLAYYIERQFDHADSCFASLYETTPEDADPLLYRAEIARAQGDPEGAEKFARQALAISEDRDDWEGVLMQARAHAKLGEAESAIEKLIRIRRDAPSNLYVNYARAQIYFAIGDIHSAKAHIRSTMELGISPVWYRTTAFGSLCTHSEFAGLRTDYPSLCIEQGNGTHIAQKE